MDSAPSFETPVTGSYQSGGFGSLTLSDRSALTKLIVKAGPETSTAVQLGALFGSSISADGALVLGQRPGEWMVLGSVAAATAIADGLDRTGHVSVIDHTHSRALFRLSGRQASKVLEKVCGIDWTDSMTPDGAVTSASVAKVGCDIARHDQLGEPSYLLACDRSFAQYLFDAVLDAGAEFDVVPDTDNRDTL